MPHVKWNLLPPLKGPNPQGIVRVKMKEFLRLTKATETDYII